MIRINKDFCIHTLKSIARMNLTLSLVVKDRDANEYTNGDDMGLMSMQLNEGDWEVTVEPDSNTCMLIGNGIEWVSSLDESVEVVGYFVFDASSVLFYDIFKNGVTLEKGHPFNLSPCLTMKYNNVDEDLFEQMSKSA